MLTKILYGIILLLTLIVATPVAALSEETNATETIQQRLLRLEEKLARMEEEDAIRKRLESTEAEEESNQEEILSAAGRDYTLMKPGILGVEYNLRYTGYTYDSLIESQKIVHNSNHGITNSMAIEYPFKENITFSGDFSFVAKMNTQSNSKVKDVSDLGDTVFGMQWQPSMSVGGGVTRIISASLSCPTGRSPYKIDPATEVSTGSGGYATSFGLNMSKQIDPLFVYGSVQYQYPMEIKHLNYKSTPYGGESGVYLKAVRPGHTLSYSMGFGYSLSYNVSLNLGYQYSYSTKTRYSWVGTQSQNSDDSMSSIFNIGTAWNIYPKRTIHVKLGFGLTNNDPDFTVSLRVPFKFEI